MQSLCLQIAGYSIAVSCLFSSTRAYFREYLTERPGEFSITVTGEGLLMEQALLDREADDLGLRHRLFADPFLERSAIMRRTAQALLSREILLLHGSTVAMDGTAYLFTAPCGVGKSTHTRLWREVFGGRAVMVNDDRAFLKPQGGQVLACGSPWCGKHGIGANLTLPLGGICLLRRGTENAIAPISAAEALPFLKTQAFLPAPEWAETVASLTARFAGQIPLYAMTCNKDPEAAILAYRILSQDTY